jgi:hypothetical protein
MRNPILDVLGLTIAGIGKRLTYFLSAGESALVPLVKGATISPVPAINPPFNMVRLLKAGLNILLSVGLAMCCCS